MAFKPTYVRRKTCLPLYGLLILFFHYVTRLHKSGEERSCAVVTNISNHNILLHAFVRTW